MLMEVKQSLRGPYGRGVRNLGVYETGFTPARGYGWAPSNPQDCAGCGPTAPPRMGRLGRVRGLGMPTRLAVLRGLGAVNPMDPSVAFDTGSLFTDYNPANWVESGPGAISAPPMVTVFPAAPGGGTITSQQLAQISQLTAAEIGSGSNLAPGASPQTLMQAAAMPNAPAVVKQAAAQYAAANPTASFLSGSIGGIPTTYLLAGGAVLLFAIFGMKGR